MFSLTFSRCLRRKLGQWALLHACFLGCRSEHVKQALCLYGPICTKTCASRCTASPPVACGETIRPTANEQTSRRQREEGEGCLLQGHGRDIFLFYLEEKGVWLETHLMNGHLPVHILGLKTYFLFPPQALILSGSLQASQCFDSLGICSLMWTQLQEMTTILDPKNKIK